MGTLNRSSFLAAAAAAIGLGHLSASLGAGVHAGAPPALAYHGVGRRSRTPGDPQLSGAKLARRAAKGTVGIAVLR